MRVLAALWLSLALAGCMVGPDYRRPDAGLPSGFGEATVANGAAAVPHDWWKLYGDATLDGLVESGLAHNTDVLAAVARVEEAEAALREANATLFFPLVQGNAGATRSRSIVQGDRVTGNNFTLGLSTSFEVDLWGRLRRAELTTRAQLAASVYGRETVSLTVAATIARAYFALRSLDSQVAASESITRATEESLAIARRRADAGIASELDVYQAAGARSAASAQTKEFRRQRAAIAHQLGVLAGRVDLAFGTGAIDTLPLPPLPLPPPWSSAVVAVVPDVAVVLAVVAGSSPAGSSPPWPPLSWSSAVVAVVPPVGAVVPPLSSSSTDVAVVLPLVVFGPPGPRLSLPPPSPGPLRSSAADVPGDPGPPPLPWSSPASLP